MIYIYTFTRLCLFIALTLLSSAAVYGNSYWYQYGESPVLMEYSNNGAMQTLNFLYYKEGMLVAEIDGGFGEVSMPVGEQMARQLKVSIPGITKAKSLVNKGNLIGALKILRKSVYPLIKFSRLPEEFTQLHSANKILLRSLIQSDKLDEAKYLLAKIPLEYASLQYSELAIELLNKYTLIKDWDSVIEITRSLPHKNDHAANIKVIMDSADKLRSAGRYDAVILLYQSIQKDMDTSLQKNLQIWLAYSLVLADRQKEASSIIDGIEKPNIEDDIFSLYQLLIGARAHRSGDYTKALDLLTRGFVRTQTSYSWVPEHLYLIGDSYLQSGDSIAAKNVWKELTILYPKSPWAGKVTEY
ncbi:MAG: hypothetical protein CL815_05840 [Coraliomargarita sp.]|nr:hypothetical protein [Coraliomargarita sp.]|tara:strand:+ start:10762 stop:11832 length:1071 start_codon:yes stop_codon:yes gene_type:complete